jgi:hypothetical protein
MYSLANSRLLVQMFVDTPHQGQNASLSYIAIPALMQASAPVAAKQWEKAYDIGKSTAPPLAIISALATGYVAYHRKFRCGCL